MKRIKLTLMLPAETAETLKKLKLISGKSRTAIISELVAKYGQTITSEKITDVSDNVSDSNSRLT